MATETLEDYDRLIESGFTDQQSRVLVELFAKASRTDPEVIHTLKLILQEINGMNGRLDRIEGRLDRIEGRLDGLEGRMDGLEGRMASESRVFRMINTTLLAVGATLASLLAVFAR